MKRWVLQSPIDLLQKWKAGKLRFTTDSAGMSAFMEEIWMCVHSEPEGLQKERQQQLESDANSLATVLLIHVHASMYVMCVWEDGSVGDF